MSAAKKVLERVSLGGYIRRDSDVPHETPVPHLLKHSRVSKTLNAVPHAAHEIAPFNDASLL